MSSILAVPQRHKDRSQRPAARSRAGDPLQCRLIDDPNAMPELAGRWDSLVRRSEFVDVFSTSGFARAWWKAFGPSRLLRLLVVEQADATPRLIAPCYADASAPGAWKLIGDFRADYTNFVFAAGDHESLSALFSWLQRRRDWQTLRM